MTNGLRCPNCYHDISDTDYTPNEIVYFIDGEMAAVDAKDVKKAKTGHETSPGKEIPLHCISSDLFAHARFARNYSIGIVIIILISVLLTTQMLFSTTKSSKILLSIFIPLFVFFLLDIILSSLILLGKEWVLAAYIPFAIITFPLLFLYEILLKRDFYRSKILLSSRFFINDFRDYLKYRREEKERKEIE
ncbi:MAG: hypothetical protein JW817_03940 [Clostridiales bacterium]|nr:hypothetical protein [Clostridiales bacterium]